MVNSVSVSFNDSDLSVDIADLLYTFSGTDDHKPKPFIFLSQVLLLFLFVMLLINNY